MRTHLLFIFAFVFSGWAFATETFPTYTDVQKLPGRVAAAEANICSVPRIGPDGKPCAASDTKPKTGAESVVAAAAVVRNDADVKRELAFYEAYKTTGYFDSEVITAQSLRKQIESQQTYLTEYEKKVADNDALVAALTTLTPNFAGASIPSPLPTVSNDGLTKFRANIKQFADEATNGLTEITTEIASYQASIARAKTAARKRSLANELKYYSQMLSSSQEQKAKALKLQACVASFASDLCPEPVVTQLRTRLAATVADTSQNSKYYRESIDESKKRIESLKTRLAAQEALEAQQAQNAMPTDAEKLAKLELEGASRLSGMTGNSGYQDCGMSVGERLAVSYYTGSGYGAINAALRTGGDALKKIQPIIDELNSALRHLKPFNGYVIRGGNLPPAVRAQHTVGAVVNYAAFTSTSLTKGFEANDRFVIHSRDGRYIGSYSSSYQESEVLLPSNSKFKILSVQKVGSVTTYVMDEVAP